jgi:hypothetical protein
VATIILDNTQKKKRAVRIDRYCRVIFPVIFGIASIATFAASRAADPNKGRHHCRTQRASTSF